MKPQVEKCMIVVNLHELDFIEKTLTILGENYVRDCVVYNAEGIASRHGESIPSFGFVTSSISSLFKESRNLNNVILAVVEKKRTEAISKKLKKLHKESRYAASFWFVPIENYFYHKGIE